MSDSSIRRRNASAEAGELSNLDPLLLPPSAALKVLDIPELRQHIIEYLDKSSVARLMSVDRRFLEDGARSLYKQVTTEFLYSKLKLSGNSISQITRLYLYRSMVTVIDARQVKFTYRVLRDYLGAGTDTLKGAGTKERQAKYARLYRPEIITYFVPKLKRKCSQLRQIWFGDLLDSALPGHRWTVHLAPHNDPLYPSPTDGIPILHGHIVHIRNVSLPRSWGTNPDTASEIPPSPPDFESRYRFNLCLGENSFQYDPSSLSAIWLSAIRSSAKFANLYQELNIGDLSGVTLDNLTSLYKRQIDAGHRKRLSTIHAINIEPFDLLSFRGFASMASMSLNVLKLAWKYDERSLLAFVDLPGIIRVVRQSLPNLSVLHVSMLGIATAEADCQNFLHEHTLDERGKIRDLRIYSGSESVRLFAVIRCLSSICADDAISCFMIGSNGDLRCMRPSDSTDRGQREFISYLRNQVPVRRLRVSTIDFTTLDCKTLSDAYLLEYAENGRPRRRLETKAIAMTERTTTAFNLAIPTFIPNLQTGLFDAQASSQRLQAMIASDGPGSAVLAEARTLLSSLERVEEAFVTADKIRQHCSASDIRGYVEELEKEQKEKEERVNRAGPAQV